jgi:hypothetical protein
MAETARWGRDDGGVAPRMVRVEGPVARCVMARR